MNKARRQDLETVIKKYLDPMGQQVADALNDLEQIRDEEQEAYENLPESMQNSERGETMSEALENLFSAIYAMGQIGDLQDEVVSSIEQAQA